MLWLSIGSLLLLPARIAGQAGPQPVSDTMPLGFLGFHAGVRQAELQDLASQTGRGTLACETSAVDPRLGECRGSLPELDAGRSVDFWASVIDGRGAVTTLSARLTPARFDRWRTFLEGRYGTTPERHQGPMTVLQWVRHGQMLRLSWRSKGRDMEASVSLVDGPLLDGWANQGRRPRN